MIWMDYNIEQYPDGSIKVKGDTEHELVEKGLFKPGDVFVVTPDGTLKKVDELSKFIMQKDVYGRTD